MEEQNKYIVPWFLEFIDDPLIEELNGGCVSMTLPNSHVVCSNSFNYDRQPFYMTRESFGAVVENAKEAFRSVLLNVISKDGKRQMLLTYSLGEWCDFRTPKFSGIWPDAEMVSCREWKK